MGRRSDGGGPGSALRRQRELRGWSQAQVAQRVGAPSPEHVSRWERGVVRPSPHYRERFCRLYGATAEELGFVAPPAALPSAGSNLPQPLTRLIGRDAEVAAVGSLLTTGHVRLLTLTGPPGVGKTVLGLAAAAAVESCLPDGARFVGLAPLSDASLVGPAIATALGPRLAASDPTEALIRQLRERAMLLVLDNFEHVLTACGLVSQVLAACPGVRMLVTSRSTLRAKGERVCPVLPLTVPGAALPADPALVAAVPAVALFIDRAQAYQPSFALGANNAATIAEVCRRLDGLPLALELAAAWAEVLGPNQLLARLSRRLPMLERGPLDVPARQRTMRATLRWSYDLLDPEEQRAFRRFSIFAGSASLDAIQAVWRMGDPLPLLASLVDKHLLVRVGSEDEPRFQMLQVVREYAGERLVAAGEREAAATAHLDHFASFAEAAAPNLQGREQTRWMARLELEHDNIRAGLRWAGTGEAQAAGLRLAARIWRFWDAHGHAREGRRWLDDLLASAEAVGPKLKAEALCAAGHMALRCGQYDEAVPRYRESLALFDRAGDRQARANVLNGLATIALRQGGLDQAATMFEDCLAIYRSKNDQRATAVVLDNLALVVKQRGDHARALCMHEESLSIRRAIDDRIGIVMTLNNMAEVAFLGGQHERVDELLGESVTLCRELGAVRWLSFALSLSGRSACRRGDLPAAAERSHESLRLALEIGDPLNIADALVSLAMLACRRRQWRTAARRLGAAAGVRDAMGIPQSSTERALCEPLLAQIADAMGGRACQAALAAGRQLSPEAAAR